MHAIRTAITLSLALTFPTTGAFAADLTGSKCKTVNQTKIILGKEYKCVKQAGKKTWRQLIVPTQVAYSNLSKEEAEVYNLLDKQIAQLNSQLNAGVAPK